MRPQIALFEREREKERKKMLWKLWHSVRNPNFVRGCDTKLLHKMVTEKEDIVYQEITRNLRIYRDLLCKSKNMQLLNC